MKVPFLQIWQSVVRRRRDKALYRAALAVERDETLAAEMREWETSTVGDGCEAPLENSPRAKSGRAC